MKELVVVAIGGNSIIKDNASQSIEHQAEAVKAVADTVLEMLASDYDIVLTHGNGPQVGFILLRSDLARNVLHEVPLDSCVADTQGALGYQIGQTLANELRRQHIQKSIATVVTQVLVDKNDPAFSNPTKPIGSFYTEAEAQKHRADSGWILKEDAGRG